MPTSDLCLLTLIADRRQKVANLARTNGFGSLPKNQHWIALLGYVHRYHVQ